MLNIKVGPRSTATDTLCIAALASIVASTAPQAQAASLQSVLLSLFDTSGALLREETDATAAPGEEPLPRTVDSALVGSDHSGLVELTPVGALSMSGALFSAGRLEIEAFSEASELIARPFSRVIGTFVIDGGRINLLGPAGASARLTVEVQSSIRSRISGFEVDLTMDDDFANSTLSVLDTLAPGEELLTEGPTPDVGFRVDIPTQVVTVDFGRYLGGPLWISYRALIEIETSGPTEIASIEYRDPLSIIFEGPSFTPVGAPVPLPAPLAFLLSGIAALGFAAWRAGGQDD